LFRSFAATLFHRAAPHRTAPHRVFISTHSPAMASARLTFRLATPADASQLKRLIEAAFRAEDSRPEWTADMCLSDDFHVAADDIAAKTAAPDSAFIIAQREGNPLVATLGVSRVGDLCRLALLAVDPAEQQGGTGRSVLAHAEKYAQDTWGVTKFGLNALCTRQKLIEWYKRCGYSETGETSPFPKPGMGDLFFVELSKDVSIG
jgi:N-acetylglutamate synthase-like GNAT family acetyltransferase